MIPEVTKLNDSSNSETDNEFEPNFDDPEDFVDDISDEGKISTTQHNRIHYDITYKM